MTPRPESARGAPRGSLPLPLGSRRHGSGFMRRRIANIWAASSTSTRSTTRSISPARPRRRRTWCRRPSSICLLRQHAQLTEEELARAVRLDPSQIRGLGPSLERFDGDARANANVRFWRPMRPTRAERRPQNFHDRPSEMQPPAKLARRSSGPCAKSNSTNSSNSGTPPATRTVPFARRLAASRRTARRQIPGGRIGRQVRLHRPHSR